MVFPCDVFSRTLQATGVFCLAFHPALSFTGECLPASFPRWNCIMTTHGPPPMAGHSSCVIEDKMIVFGGSLGSRQM